MYKGVHTIKINFISSSIVLEDESAAIPPLDKLPKIDPLMEQNALNRSVANWSMPKFPAYVNIHERLQTFRTWPYGMNPSPSSLSAAGFYYTGKNIVFSYFFLDLSPKFKSLVTKITHSSRCAWSNALLPLWCWIRELGNHRRSDRRTCLLFPFCVFVRYIKWADYVHECRRKIQSTKTPHGNDFM